MKPIFNTTADEFAAETEACMRAFRCLSEGRRANDAAMVADALFDLDLLSTMASSPAVRARSAREIAVVHI